MKNNLVPVLILTALVAVLGTWMFFDYKQSKPVQKDYKATIDSITALIDKNNLEFAKFDSINRRQQVRILKLQTDLTNLNIRTTNNFKHYEQEINRLNNLTDSQLVIIFTDAFDYD